MAASDFLNLYHLYLVGTVVFLQTTSDDCLTAMKFSALLTGAFVGLMLFYTTLAAKSFTASNFYNAAGLKDSQQTFLLKDLQSAGVKVLRVWLDGKTQPYLV